MLWKERLKVSSGTIEKTTEGKPASRFVLALALGQLKSVKNVEYMRAGAVVVLILKLWAKGRNSSSASP